MPIEGYTYFDCPIPGHTIILSNGTRYTVIASSHGRDDGGPHDFYTVILLAPIAFAYNYFVAQISPWVEDSANHFTVQHAETCKNIGAAVALYTDMGGDAHTDELGGADQR